MRVTGMDATYYTVENLDAEVAFYTKLLGAEPGVLMPNRIAEWEFDDGSAFGLYRTEEKIVKKSGAAMFAVTDMEQAIADARADGIGLHGDAEITDTPVCRMVFGADPEGNEFILHHRKTH